MFSILLNAVVTGSNLLLGTAVVRSAQAVSSLTTEQSASSSVSDVLADNSKAILTTVAIGTVAFAGLVYLRSK